MKVQIPLNAGVDPVALVYDESRDFMAQTQIDEELLQKMSGEPKAFFYADIRADGFRLLGLAPWQLW